MRMTRFRSDTRVNTLGQLVEPFYFSVTKPPMCWRNSLLNLCNRKNLFVSVCPPNPLEILFPPNRNPNSCLTCNVWPSLMNPVWCQSLSRSMEFLSLLPYVCLW
eukprot:Lithocolla_globosa_v1_NODE_658_length_3496_cov_53.897995.p3 type:complete len:104 gc:universal NODE_658_length_3496_cov_53.897995:789-478(-)